MGILGEIQGFLHPKILNHHFLQLRTPGIILDTNRREGRRDTGKRGMSQVQDTLVAPRGPQSIIPPQLGATSQGHPESSMGTPQCHQSQDTLVTLRGPQPKPIPQIPKFCVVLGGGGNGALDFGVLGYPGGTSEI